MLINHGYLDFKIKMKSHFQMECVKSHSETKEYVDWRRFTNAVLEICYSDKMISFSSCSLLYLV
jgi:hypothetical protein